MSNRNKCISRHMVGLSLQNVLNYSDEAAFFFKKICYASEKKKKNHL